MYLEYRGLVGLDDKFTQWTLGYVVATSFIPPIADVVGTASFFEDDLFVGLPNSYDGIDGEVCR